MILSGLSIEDNRRIETQLCIVGSGVAGIAVALELAGAGKHVVMLEAGGGGGPDLALTAAQRGDTAGTDHEPIEQVTTRRLGGALALWGGRLAPIDDEDLVPFAGRSTGWPVSADDLAPFLSRANCLLGGGAYEYDSRTALGPQRLLPTAGDARVEDRKVWRWGPPVRFGDFAARLAREPLVTVITNAVVTNLRVMPNDRRVEAAEVRRPDGTGFEVVAQTFVVACGGIETTRLLLGSRNEHQAGIGNGYGLAGVGYMTHPVAEVGAVRLRTISPSTACSFQRTHDGVYARRMITATRTTRAEFDLPNVNVTFWNPDPHDPSHGDGLLSLYALLKSTMVRFDLTDKVAGAHRAHTARDLFLKEHLRNILATAPRTTFAAARWLTDRRLRQRKIPALLAAGRAGVIRLRFDAEQSADPANRLEPLRQVDAFGLPRVRVHFRVSDADKDGYYRTLELVASEFARRGFGTVELPGREAFGHLQITDGTHQMGLLRMADDERSGVVDPWCRVHSMQNLYVASSAVFPTSGAAPPTLTLVALALRTASKLIHTPTHDR
jgi:choline dehydrogenase-like flavoprotein